ncbi:peroxin Pex23-like-penicillium chrysogenum [Aspergillus sclerotioniger CBS 115572]|uniref:Peroxin Pex23-like-penicillium chrysogenum n=1 Tax=Aspergillus sclerotioniger CBS 115572 TaxID=1450535 RepID=A0A317WN64_9EURO|nr:peroxin Pex23-like-penicillium chrysogenum [Aspergillus sclerotioniger CBS 115572]PWY87879.1 peroxin Pex23-like-penicillium chrysogenum [Aspergillus sclerotioniger CBS 115572]
MDPNTGNIALIDNTAPRRQSDTPTAAGGSHVSRKWTRVSIRSELAKRKYAKWQPDRLGLADDDDNGDFAAAAEASRRPSDGRDLSATETATTNTPSRSPSQHPTPPSQEVEAIDFAPQETNNTAPKPPTLKGLKPNTELDILYENQRGWFFFGIPLYSHSSLLNFDPSAWMTADHRDSPVDITNAQVPDPSWVWAWRSWYVDMSGDVDDQGWQYSFSFASRAWHGSHPWFHSFVRRRRWVRVRVKRLVDRRGRTGLEMAHRLNEDYFTIHSGKNKRAASEAGMTTASAGYYTNGSLSRTTTKVNDEEEAPVEEIADIPALMHALRVAIVDREKVDALDRFLDEGGEELFYLHEQIPEIMSMFVFQASRWQFLTHLTEVIDDLSQKTSQASGTEATELQRKLDHLQKATEAARRHLTGPEVLRTENRDSKMDMLDLTPAPKRGSLLARYSGKFSFKPMDDGGEIKGIPKEAEVAPMLSRGRPCLKRRSISTVLDNVTEEPLLFLYPRWATAAVRQRSLFSSVRHAGKGKSLYNTSAARGSLIGRSGPVPRVCFGAESRRWVSDTLLEEKKELEEEGQLDTAQEGNGDEQSQQGTTLHRTIDDGEPPPIEVQRERQRRVFNVFSDLPMQPLQLSSSRKGMRSAAADSDEPPAIAVRRLSPRDRRKLRYRLFLTESRPRSCLDEKWNKWINMREIIEDLQNKDMDVSVKEAVKQKELLLPEETLAILAGVTDMALKENIWYVPVHNGCKVHVLPPAQSQGQFRKVILSGSERVVEMVSDKIEEAKGFQERNVPMVEIQKPVVPVIPSVEAMKRQNIPVPLVRGVWDIQSAVTNPAKFHLLLPAGNSLTCVRDFAEHVEELTRSKPSYDSDIHYPHNRQVAKRLVQLFRHQEYYSFISTAALNRAITYLLDHEFLRSARAIFLKAEHLATVDTFNILLKSSAKRQDLLFFRHFLLAMSRLKIRPDAHTWLALLDCVISTKEKTDLVDYMVQRGYLDNTGAMRSALHLTLPNSFRAHLESGQSVDSFIRKTAEACGDSCFAPSLVSQMFGVIVRLKDFAAMDRLFQICKHQDLTFNSATVTQIMSLFRADVPTALGYLFRCLERPETKLERRAWERLFLVAYKGQYYNICRVLWRYACMSGNVTYNMKRTVVTSLIRNVPRKTEINIHTMWDTTAGKVIVGLDLHRPDPTFEMNVLDNIPPEYGTNPLAYLCSGFKPAGEEREQQIRVGSALAQHDIAVGGWYRPQLPLMIMLEAALVLDQEWRKVPRPVFWLVQNAIRVPVRKSLMPP